MGVVEKAAAGLSEAPRVNSMNPSSLSEVLDGTAEVGDAVGHGVETRERISALETRLARVEEAVAGRPRPRVGCIEWLDPLFSAGHWVSEMVRIAGGEELFAGASGRVFRTPYLGGSLRGRSGGAHPHPCGFDATRTLEEARALTEIPGCTGLPAVSNERVWAVDANSYFSRPAPKLVEEWRS